MCRTYGQTGPPIRSNSVSIQWAGLGPELLLRIERDGAEPMRVQLERGLRDAIRSGRLAAGERLPSSRRLAQELGISRGLVLECYSQLQAEGYLVARTGAATQVADAARDLGTPAVPASEASARLAVDFLAGRPDLASFPRRDWMWALREVSRSAPAGAVGYGDPRGSQRLRKVLAAYLRRVRAAAADPEQIIVCSGFAQGIGLVLRALAQQGVRHVALEDPGDFDHASVHRRSGIDTVHVPVDDHGVVVEALAATSARAAMLTPAHQAPTGVVLAPERRQELVRWAIERDAVVIEDDYDAEFRYDREPVGALQGLAPDRVATVGTVSKSLAPGLRLGWVLCPPQLVGPVAEEKDLADRGSPGLDQLALAMLIESGRYDRHLRRMRAVYAGKRRALIDALTRHAPGVELRGLAAGFHAVARLPEGVDEREVAAAARERSVGLYPMSDYRTAGHDGPPELVLGFGDLTESAIERGIATIADLLQVRA
jgi:GntR family transcriptional regulator / MocR family aminotransferase